MIRPPYMLREYIGVGDDRSIYAFPDFFSRKPDQAYTLYRRRVQGGIAHYVPVIATTDPDAFNAACRLFGVPCRALSAEETV